jgi:S1-C subfamily serine protease
VKRAPAVLLCLLFSPVWSAAQNPSAKSPAKALGDAFVSVYEKVAPSVVVLEVTKLGSAAPDGFDLGFFLPDNGQADRPPRAEESEGSGFIIREDGYIVTNAHVVEGADPQSGVVARRQDGSRLPLRVVGIDEKTDIAVLKAEEKNLPAVLWGDSDAARVGEFVCSIGAPFELDYTLTVGVLSGKGRRNLTETVYEDYLQTDAAINPGNSGGPLCDLDGRVLGVNTLINGLSRGLGFAIPAKLARTISDELIANGRVVRPWLGIRIQTLSDEPRLQQMMGLKQGVIVKTIEPDTPAASSTLQPSDVVVAVDGEKVDTAQELQQIVLRKGIGEKVRLKVWRRGATEGDFREIFVVTEELPPSPSRLASQPHTSREEGKGSLGWGLVLESRSKEEAKAAGTAPGVLVIDVEPSSPAALAGLQPRDIITGVGAEEVRDEEAFRVALGKLGQDEATVLMVERDGKKTYAIFKR